MTSLFKFLLAKNNNLLLTIKDQKKHGCFAQDYFWASHIVLFLLENNTGNFQKMKKNFRTLTSSGQMPYTHILAIFAMSFEYFVLDFHPDLF